ncbi:membrane protein [Planomonospora sphaerica]|uniref:Membrane protein n=1 Tax=Planomonospora sphaerica TaxID=161355 RepID=A0A171DDT2_9ACTN|nr:membrane protein [Planomonospora sphaerica]
MPAMLILLSAVPVVAGAVRLTELTGGAEITPENARFFAVPLPVVLHIVSVSVYSVLGAFQFAPGFRRRRPGWHRAAGRVLVPSGLVAALTGLWMTVFYPYPVGGSDLLSGIRLVFGTAMALAIVLGFAAIRRRDVVRHRAWMIRGYAIGLGAGTQVLTHLPWVLVFGAPGEVATALLMAAGWVINVAVAEWAVRRRPAVRAVRLGS